jgi:arylsulfatase A-like enzyme
MGAVQKKLEDLGLEDNTIIIFFSDNGGHRKWTTNYPLRGHKADFYEGGIRVPLIVKWPGVTAAGSVSDVPVISNDLYPTMLEMAELPLMPEQHIDGLSLLPLLKQVGELDREALYWHFPHYASMCNVIRYQDWKLIESLEAGRNVELYDLKNDIGEEHDLAAEHPGMVEKLQQMLARSREEMNVQMPVPNPAYVSK